MVSETPRVAIVHERFTEIAGSEHVVEQLAMEWPSAEVFAPIARASGVPGGLTREPTTTWLNYGYKAIREKSYAPLLPLMPMSFRHLDFGSADVVVVSHHAFAIQSALAAKRPVIGYVHSPARWAWDPAFREQEAGGRAGEMALSVLAKLARSGDTRSVQHVDVLVANSTEVANRIERWWGRDSVVVHPPVDTEGFRPDSNVSVDDFFLLAGRLVPYKRPDIAIAAARRAGVKLVVAGDGRAAEACRELAGPDTVFLGRVPHETLCDLHRRAKALLMPGVEDFGIVPVEAMASGTPVIALGAGGAIDTVIPGISGQLVPTGDDEAVIDSFASAMVNFVRSDYDGERVRAWAETFSRANFRHKMRAIVTDAASP